ncbi:MAG: Uma2 family endonuclease [Pirellulaceae bacterium]|nr:Uma2 family endonuclease [Planctomycetales bacterium]
MSTASRYQPHYRVSDYLQWEGDWELWFGTAVAMVPSPFAPHERAVTKLTYQIESSLLRHECDCRVYAGLDWIVQDDTVVRPDVMVVCGEQPEKHLERPPALAIEVLSDSTRSKDCHAKRMLYEEYGVACYLIVDVDAKSIQWLQRDADGKYQDQSSQIKADTFSVTLPDGCQVGFSRELTFQ